MEPAAEHHALQHAVMLMRDTDKFKRRRGCDALGLLLLGPPTAPGGPSSGAGAGTTAVFSNGEILGALLALFSDAAEGNREASIKLLTKCLEASEDVVGGLRSAVCKEVVQTLACRVGKQPAAEEVEELRLQLAKLLLLLLRSASCTPIIAAASLQPVADVIQACAADAFPDVKIEAASLAQSLVAVAPGAVHTVLQPIVAAFTSCLVHQRAPVRLAALEALRCLLPHGSGSLPRLLWETVLPAVKQLCHDRTPGVRKQLASAAAHWLQHLPAHARADADAPLFLLLLQLMSDENSDVSSSALGVYQVAAGHRNAGDQQRPEPPLPFAPDIATAAAAAADGGGGEEAAAGSGASGSGPHLPLPAAAAPTHSILSDHHPRSSTADGSCGDEGDGVGGGGSSFSCSTEAMEALPFPFRQAGSQVTITPESRRFARAMLPSALPLLLKDLEDWTARARVAAAGGLRSLGILAGSSALLNWTFDLIGALARRWNDEEPEVRVRLVSVSRTLGVLLPAETALKAVLAFAAEQAPGGQSSSAPLIPLLTAGGHREDGEGSAALIAHTPENHAALLAMVQGLLSTAPPASVEPLLPWLCEALSQPSLVDDSRRVRVELGGVVTQLVRHIAWRAGCRGGGMGGDRGEGADLSPGDDADVMTSFGPCSRCEAVRSSSSSRGATLTAPSTGAPAHRATLHPAPRPHPTLPRVLSTCALPRRPSLLAHHPLRLPQGALDRLLVLLLHLQDIEADEETADAARAATRLLARSQGFSHSTELFAAAVPRLLPALTSDASAWTKGSLHRRAFDALLRIGRAALSCRSRVEADAAMRTVLDAFCVTLEPGKDVDLRVAQLALLDAFIVGNAREAGDGAAPPEVEGGEGESGSSSPTPAAAHTHTHMLPTRDDLGMGVLDSNGPAFSVRRRSAGGPLTAPLDPSTLAPSVARVLDEVPERTLLAPLASPLNAALDDPRGVHLVADITVDGVMLHGGASQRIIRDMLLPSMVWRPGLVASAVRKVSVACLHSLLARKLLSPHALEPLFAGELLPVLRGCCSDDDAATRHITCQTLECCLRALHRRLGAEPVRELFGDLLKLVDDSNDAVRVAACGAAVELVGAATSSAESSLKGAIAEQAVSVLLVHLDDRDPEVQAAVYTALVAWSALAPAYAAKHAEAARDKHRRPSYCDRLIGRLQSGSS